MILYKDLINQREHYEGLYMSSVHHSIVDKIESEYEEVDVWDIAQENLLSITQELSRENLIKFQKYDFV